MEFWLLLEIRSDVPPFSFPIECSVLFIYFLATCFVYPKKCINFFSSPNTLARKRRSVRSLKKRKKQGKWPFLSFSSSFFAPLFARWSNFITPLIIPALIFKLPNEFNHDDRNWVSPDIHRQAASSLPASLLPCELDYLKKEVSVRLGDSRSTLGVVFLLTLFPWSSSSPYSIDNLRR